MYSVLADEEDVDEPVFLNGKFKFIRRVLLMAGSYVVVCIVWSYKIATSCLYSILRCEFMDYAVATSSSSTLPAPDALRGDVVGLYLNMIILMNCVGGPLA